MNRPGPPRREKLAHEGPSAFAAGPLSSTKDNRDGALLIPSYRLQLQQLLLQQQQQQVLLLLLLLSVPLQLLLRQGFTDGGLEASRWPY